MPQLRTNFRAFSSHWRPLIGRLIRGVVTFGVLALVLPVFVLGCWAYELVVVLGPGRNKGA